MSEIVEKLKNWLNKVYDEKKDVACLELPILKILVETTKNDGWITRDDIINKLQQYGDFQRGALSFDHLWSQRFGKGDEKDILNELVEHDGKDAGDKKTKYKIKDSIEKNKLKSILASHHKENLEDLIKRRLTYLDSNNRKFQEMCDCLDKAIKKSGRKLKLITKSGIEFNLIKFNKNYRVIFDTQSGRYESITLENLYQFLFEEWRGNPILGGKDDNRITLFSAIKNYIENNCNKDNNKQGKMPMSNSKQIQPLNQILYGPPGTGKTYNTINKALEIIDGVVHEDRSEAKIKFDKYVKDGQIEFVTFHQSYGYEEFVEGIKAISPDDERNTTGELIYRTEDGIFKKLAKKAEVNLYDDQLSLNATLKQYSLDYPLIGIHAKMIKDREDAYRVLKGSRIRKDTTPSFNNNNVRDTFLLKADYTDQDEYYVLNQDYTFKSISGAASIVVGAAANGNVAWKLEPLENKIEILETSQKKYILIIDEINRGNISKIFGELITLIEESKRLGKEEQVEITLPYSGEKFGVAQNLYIIGTMNTADRSIALMDTALRRRFDFTEMMPCTKLLDFAVEGINIKSMLEKINQRIEYLYDRDHTIGHAYFMSLKTNPSLAELDNIFRNKIIPLLQEYFYDDWEKIRLVLGDNQKEETFQFVKIKNGYDIKKLFGEKSIETLDYDEIQKVYEINHDAFKNPESYVKIYG